MTIPNKNYCITSLRTGSLERVRRKFWRARKSEKSLFLISFFAPALPTRAVKFSHELTQVSLLIIISLKQSSKKAGCLKRTRTRVLLASPSPIKSLKSSVSCTEFSTITVTQIRFIEGVCCRYCAVCSLHMIKTQLQKKNRWKKKTHRGCYFCKILQ